MLDLSNIILHELIKFIIAFHLGSLIFFSSIIAPTTFTSLKEVDARKFVRKVFPRLYMWSIITNSFIFISIFYLFDLSFLHLLSGLVLVGYIYSRQVLMPKINEVSDQGKKSFNRFKTLHSISVLIFISQKFILAFIYLKI
ncbi:MAG: hypothetical protein CMP33_02585 [Rickettsiales bacterium]|nr:hypothetical protein [Rickettsiales bacterium]|tara:strand:- start:1094 stop:1516 length:423 start_codon:yes stop_codon:yes gene_type:complete